MIVNALITTLVLIVAMILLSEMLTFWDDRTGLGNLVLSSAVVITLVWFATGLWQLWQ